VQTLDLMTLHINLNLYFQSFKF